MRANGLVKLKGMLRLTRAERALTLAIFLLFQALLPSYAGALSNWSGNDRLVLCTAHGLVEVDQSDQSNTALMGDTLCIVAQAGAAHMAQAPDVPQMQLPKTDVSAFVVVQLFETLRSAHTSPHAPRGPPVRS